MKVSDFAVNKPITTLMLVTSIIVIGLVSVYNMPLEFLPVFSSTYLRIWIPYPSSSPAEVEDLIAIPVEEMMATVKNVDMIRSRSTSSGASISIRFKDGTDMDVAATEVRDKLDKVRTELPDDVERIFIYRFQSTDLPAIELSVSFGADRSQLQSIVRDVLQRRLQRLEGVANVDVRGIQEPQLIVELDRERMQSHGVDTYLLRKRLRQNNLNVSAGYIIEGGRRYIVRAMGEFRSVREVARLPIKGTKVRLCDVADVRYGFPERKNYQLLNCKDAVTLVVFKSSEANLVSVARRVKREIDEILKDPRLRGLQIHIIRDHSEAVMRNLINLKNAGVVGAVLVVCILYFFLRNVVPTFIIAAAIPLSILCTFCLMFLDIRLLNSTLTLNIISMSGLMVSLGMLVDPAVVVLENIFRLKQDEGLSPRDAALRGSAEVAVAMIAATATTMCVFVSLIFFSRTWMAVILRDFAVAICFALAASLIVSLTVVPLFASRLLIGRPRKRSLFVRALTVVYERIMRVTLRHRLLTLALALLVGSFSFYLYSSLGRSGVYHRPARRVRIRVDSPRTYDVEDTRRLFLKLSENLLKRKEELEIEAIGCYLDRSGGMLDIFLTSDEEARRSTEEIDDEIKSTLPRIPGVRYRVGRRWGIGGEELGISVEILGRNMETLERIAERVKNLMEAIPMVKDVDTNLESGNDEIRAIVSRERAQMYGLSPQRVAWGVAAALSERATSKFKTEDREVDILVQVKEEDRASLDQLKDMRFWGEDERSATFGQLAEFKRVRGARAIERQDRMSIVRVTANVPQKMLYTAKELIRDMMKNVNMPPGYKWYFGDERWRRREQKQSSFALIFAVIFIYMIMASLFESFSHPFVMLLAIPFAFTGVAFVFHFIGNPIDDLSSVGVLLLCGLVVNNSIVLIDYINRLRRSGMDKSEAIIKGGRDRLRPVLMTALTTILGLLPMVLPLLLPAITRVADDCLPSFLNNAYHSLLALGERYLPSMFKPLEGRERTWAPMSLAVVAGLTTSTFLTLVILPTIYSLVDDFSSWLKRVFIHPF